MDHRRRATSLVEFGIRHLMITTVKGRFGGVEGTIKGNLDDYDRRDGRSEDRRGQHRTRDEKRDNHLRSGDFFEVEKYPHITFKSTKVTKTGDDTYAIDGELTIRDVTKPVTPEDEFLGKADRPVGQRKESASAPRRRSTAKISA